MARNRPGAATAAGVLCIIYGSLGIMCGLFGILGLVLQNMDGGLFGGAEQKMAQEFFEKEVPFYNGYTIMGVLIHLIEAIALLVAGIGILSLKNSARTLALIFLVVSIIWHIVSALFQFIFMIPALSRFFDLHLGGQAGPQVQAVKTGMMIGAIAGAVFVILLVAYQVVAMSLLLKKHVRQAFEQAGGGEFEDDQGSDNRGRYSGYEDEDDWQKPPPRGDEPDEGHFREQR